jgi:hypothetical protein
MAMWVREERLAVQVHCIGCEESFFNFFALPGGTQLISDC